MQNRADAQHATELSSLKTFAFDHRMQLEEMEGYSLEKGSRFKELCLAAILQVQDGRPGYGILCDSRIGGTALRSASGTGLWIGRPTELPGTRPIEFEAELGADFSGLDDWPQDNVVKLLVFAHPDDDAETKAVQEDRVRRLFNAARHRSLEFLLELVPSKVGPVGDATTAELVEQFCDAGIQPDLWKLEPLKSHAAWAKTAGTIKTYCPNAKGIVVLGLDAPEDELTDSFAIAAAEPLVKGFAVGRTILGDAARAWFKHEMDENDAVALMASRYARLCNGWDEVRSKARSET